MANPKKAAGRASPNVGCGAPRSTTRLAEIARSQPAFWDGADWHVCHPDHVASDVERKARETLARAGRQMIDGVERALPGWAQRQAERIVEAWGAHTPEEQRAIGGRAREAGGVAAGRIAAELTELFEIDPDAQRLTPLQVVRTAYREVATVLRDAGLPPVVRDPFDERVLPDDDYNLAPRTLADLGDEDLGSVHLTWGAAKAVVHKARRAPS